MLAQLKLAGGRNGRKEDRRLAWIMWANSVLTDLGHLRRKVPFPAPAEVDDLGGWVKVRKLVERHRRPRTRLKPAEQALLIDVGDWLVSLRAVEAENAATLECLIHAARVLWAANGKAPNAGADAIYDHVANEWGVMPPPLDSLGSRRAVMRLCVQWMREEDLCPTWLVRGAPVPRELREEKPEDGVEQAAPPTTAGLFGGVDP